jgi:hypothetical protein
VRILILLVCLAGCGRKSTPSCAEVADHVQTLFGAAGDAYATDLRGVFATRCEQDQWPAAMRTCLIETRSLVEPKNCRQQLTPEQSAKLDADITAADEREVSQVIPDVCGRYERMLPEVLACQVLPKDVRDSLKRSYDEFKATWVNVKDKRTLAPICGSAVSSVKMAASECPGAAKW